MSGAQQNAWAVGNSIHMYAYSVDMERIDVTLCHT